MLVDEQQQPAGPQDIVVPTSLPMILKQFCKAAIRTQPSDLLKWSSSYFRALADGEEAPVKFRLEYPPPSCTPCGLTLGFLRILLRQFGDYNKLLPVETILRRWDCLCLDRKELSLIMSIGRFRRRCQVKKFLAIACGLLGASLFESMVMICELFTQDPVGGSAMIPVTLFMEIYGYLAGLRCDGAERVYAQDAESMIGDLSVSDDCKVFPKGSVSLENDQSLGLVHSQMSQDTDADANLDLELVSKDDPESARSPLESVPLIERQAAAAAAAAPAAEAQLLNERNERNESSVNAPSSSMNSRCSSRQEEEGKSSNSHQQEYSSPKDDGNRSSKDERPITADSKDASQKSEKNGDRAAFSADRKRGKMSDNIRRKHYPNIAGIGPRLSADHVASLAIWLSECARLQDGMVGPRNLRHIDCPPLDKEEQSNS